MCLVVGCFFFFQAEDGIRVAQESRGLGDVYKRQPLLTVHGSSGRYSATGGAQFEGAQFEVPSRPARGTAKSMSLDTEGNARLEDVTFTLSLIHI